MGSRLKTETSPLFRSWISAAFGLNSSHAVMISYFATAPTGRLILWGYLIWYLNISLSYFESSWTLWGNSLGIALVVGTALVLSTTPWPILWQKLDRWQIMRLYLMPFCVSSYSALIKGQGFVFLFPPAWNENLRGLALELAFVAWLGYLRRRKVKFPETL